jgi:hypothetical protein
MQIRTLKTLPRVILMLAIFSPGVWWLGKSALPRERIAGIILAICTVVVPVLFAWNWYVSEKQASETIKKMGVREVDGVSYRTDQEIVAAFRTSVNICGKDKDGNGRGE